jgi:hypothetical protein
MNNTTSTYSNCQFCKRELVDSVQKTKKFCSTNCRVKAYQKRKRNTPSMTCYVCKEGVLTYRILLNKAPQIKCTNCSAVWKAE